MTESPFLPYGLFHEGDTSLLLSPEGIDFGVNRMQRIKRIWGMMIARPYQESQGRWKY